MAFWSNWKNPFKRSDPASSAPEPKGVIIPLPEDVAPEPLDVTKDYRIGMPLFVVLPILPLETFSERVGEQFEIEVEKLRKLVKGSIFRPMPDGSLKVYPPTEGEKKQ